MGKNSGNTSGRPQPMTPRTGTSPTTNSRGCGEKPITTSNQPKGTNNNNSNK